MSTATIATEPSVDSPLDTSIPAGELTVPRRVKPRKRLVRRVEKDLSQCIRVSVQAFFLVLNLWIGVQFYMWVRWAETGGQVAPVSRPPGVEGWLPIEGMMQFKYVFTTWRRACIPQPFSCSSRLH